MILVTGANGQLGTELRHLLDERNEEYVAVDVAEMDITDAEKVDEVFAEVKPTLVYHCAAYTAVDAAEDEGKELDYAINVTGTANVAKAAEKHGATLVYISTDYVFDGWTRTLAEFMTYLAENRKEYGYYHLSNDAAEDTTWYDFAVEILKDTDVEVKPVDSSQFPAKAKRPLNSTMSLAKAKATGFVIPTWQDALKEFYKQEVK